MSKPKYVPDRAKGSATSKQVPASATRKREADRRVPSSPLVDGSWQKCRPVWALQYFDFDGVPDTFGWHRATAEDLRTALDALKKRESCTWNELLVEQNKHNHEIDVTRLCKEAKDRLAALSLDEYERMLTFRVGSKQRLWGFRNQHVVFLVWWDPEHLVYPVEPKNT